MEIFCVFFFLEFLGIFLIQGNIFLIVNSLFFLIGNMNCITLFNKYLLLVSISIYRFFILLIIITVIVFVLLVVWLCPKNDKNIINKKLELN